MAGLLTRDPSQTPFASNSVFNLPLGLDAQWQYNAQLAGAGVFVNTENSNYNENIYTGTASDPLVTVTNTAGAGGTPGTFQVHIPAGASGTGGSDRTLSVDDTTTGTWYGFGGFTWTGSNSATVRQGSGESDTGSGIEVDGSNWDQGVGTLRQSDLQAGTINHMLRMELPTSMLQSVLLQLQPARPLCLAANGGGRQRSVGLLGHHPVRRDDRHPGQCDGAHGCRQQCRREHAVARVARARGDGS